MISIENCKKRRTELIKRMKDETNGKDSCLILYSSPERLRNGDTHYKYRFSSDIFFLTGIKDPEVILIIRTKQPYTVAFVLPKEPDKEVWTGIRKSADEIKELYSIDEVYSINDLNDKMYELIEDYEHLFVSFVDSEIAMSKLSSIINTLGTPERRNAKIRREIMELLKDKKITDTEKVDKELIDKISNLKNQIKQPISYPPTIHDANQFLSEMRKEKSIDEVNALREAIAITKTSFINTIKFTKPNMNERDIFAFIEYEFRKNGADYTGFETITASGINATILHYIQNDCDLKDDMLMLIDAGAEKDGYTADISRTFPIGKKFTPIQKEVYNAVLYIEKKVMEMVKPSITLKELNEYCAKLSIEALKSLKVLKGDSEILFLLDAYKPFYMHGVSHFLGLDAHDMASQRHDIEKVKPLRKGAIITVEPGLYFGKIAKDVTPEELYGIGIRIEDDVLVTENGYENLSSDIPKEITDIEILKQ